MELELNLYPSHYPPYSRVPDSPSSAPQIDHEEPLGPKGKTPWITLNGEDVGDSQMIIEKLAAKFGKEFDAHLSQEEKAVAHALRIMVDEYFFWYGSGLLVFALFLAFYLPVSLSAFLSNAHR